MRIIANVYEETDYDVFKRLLENRDVTPSRFRQLVESISEKYILNPIIVNEKYEVIEGQGRFEARKALGLPIHYIMVRGATIEDCRRLNKFNTRWMSSDFAESHAKSGNESYIRLLAVCKDLKLPIARALRLSNHGSVTNKDNPARMSVMERGDLVFTESDAFTVEYINTCALEILDALQFTGRRNDAFFAAVKVMVETKGYDHNRMLQKCKTERNSYAQMARLIDQLKEFERIYNKGLPAKSKLYFSDYMRNKGSNVRDYNSDFRRNKSQPDISTLKKED